MGILKIAFFIVLLTASYQDIKKMEIKDGCHAAIVLLAAATMLLDRNTGIASRLLGALCVSAPMLALTLAIPGAFGGGDIKLMASIWRNAVISAVFAVFAAGVYVLYLLSIKKADRNQRFAFGPFLCAGMAVSLLWGDEIWKIWQNL